MTERETERMVSGKSRPGASHMTHRIRSPKDPGLDLLSSPLPQRLETCSQLQPEQYSQKVRFQCVQAAPEVREGPWYQLHPSLGHPEVDRKNIDFCSWTTFPDQTRVSSPAPTHTPLRSRPYLGSLVAFIPFETLRRQTQTFSYYLLFSQLILLPSSPSPSLCLSTMGTVMEPWVAYMQSTCLALQCV